MAHDKRGKSALSLSQTPDFNYLTAQRMMRKIRTVMAERDDQYKLSGMVDMDDSNFWGLCIPGTYEALRKSLLPTDSFIGGE
jgi:hypothetical protein